MRNERRGMKDEETVKHASLVLVSKEIDPPSSIMIVLLALLLTLSSCGYGFTPVGGVIPEGAGSIAIFTFVNNSKEPYAGTEVTKAAVDEFLSDGRLKVVEPEAADLLLKGTVVKFEATPQSYTADSYVQQYQVGIQVDVKLEYAKTRQVLWQENGLRSVFAASYPVTIGDITVTKIAKETALKKASQDVARTIRSRILEGF